MRYAFISDIHGNATALDAVLMDIEKQKADAVFVLGDLAYRGPEPVEALSRVRELNANVIKGNADEWVVRGLREGEVPERMLTMMEKERAWCRSKLSDLDVDYLKGLPSFIDCTIGNGIRIHAFHAACDSLFDIIPPDASSDTLEQKLLRPEKARPELVLYAHIHLPYIRYVNGTCIVNLGSVGLPFDGMPQASYALVEVDGSRFRVSIERVPYDTEAVARLYAKHQYPNAELMQRVVRQAVSPFSVK